MSAALAVPPPMDNDKLAALVIDAVANAAAKQPAGVADALAAINATGNSGDMYAACCGFAEIGRRALTTVYGSDPAAAGRDGMWALAADDSAQPPVLFAMRFLVAACNDDRPQLIALYAAAEKATAEQFIDSVCELLSAAAGLQVLAMQQQSTTPSN